MKFSLTTKVFASLVLLSLFSLLFLFATVASHLKTAYKEQLVTSGQATAELLAGMSSAPLIFEQPESADLMLSSVSSTPSIKHVALYNIQEQQHLLFSSIGEAESDWSYRPEALAEFTQGWLHIVRPVKFEDMQIGWIHLQMSLDPLQQQLSDLYRATAIAFVITLGLALLLALAITKGLLAPLQQLRSTSTEIALTKNYGLRVKQKSVDEIGQMVSAFNSMLDDIEGFIREKNAQQQQVEELNLKLELKVSERTEQLENSMLQLHKTLQDLQLTQRKVVEQEKLASLGSLVAGVAHEINTPVGVAVTMSTTFAEKLRLFLQKVGSGQLRRTELDSFVQDTEEGLELLHSSLDKAARLIQSFKQVAVDQTSEERRSFRLNDVMDELLRTLRHQLKNRNIGYQLNMPADIYMDSYPGPLGQVVTNLFNNAVLHGFDGRDYGFISISAEQSAAEVVVKIRDDGQGIVKELLPRIFEPFVTTKLGQGGSGLGLHIVHNIVTGILGGEIQVSSEPQQGCCFTLILPLTAPRRGKQDD